MHSLIVYRIDATASGATPAKELGVRGIRAAQNVLGDRLAATHKRAGEAWDAAVETLSEGGEYVLGQHESLDTAQEAAGAAVTASEGVLGVQAVLKPLEASEASDAPAPGEIEFDAHVYEVWVDPETGAQATETVIPPGYVKHTAVSLDDLQEGLADRAPFSWPSVAYALTALAIANGNASVAHATALAYARHEHPETWGDVAAILKLAFPND